MHYSWTHKFHFSATFSLKMSLTVLFTHLKIILLQYFSIFSFSFQFSTVSKRTLSSLSLSLSLFIFLIVLTTKKSSYPCIFFQMFLQTTIIDKSVLALFENTGRGNPITATQNRRFTKHCNRRPITAFFKNVGIGNPKALG